MGLSDYDPMSNGGLVEDVMKHLEEQSVRAPCPTCKRGGTGLMMLDYEDLEALIVIKEGFDKYRRNFTPEMAERMNRISKVIGYVHAMIAGTRP